MTFSGALTLTDLNDFITPSQACIKPVEQVKPQDIDQPYSASTQIRIDSSGSYYEVPSTTDSLNTTVGRKLETAQISLNDCLACSGCITSAESVLITLQSHEEVLDVLQNNAPPTSSEHRIPILSIAPQSLASLAASVSSSSKNQISPKQILSRVQAFCRQELGFEHVFDTSFARHISLLEHRREFLERRVKARDGSDKFQLPMLASACPGWICYAEKTHSEMLPFISCTKSPQQVMGTLVKNWLGEKLQKRPNEIYHVTVMPCYDKKLEASRQDFYNEIFSTRDVDCVLTTGELELMMRERGWDLSMPVRNENSAAEQPVSSDGDFPELLSHPGTSSGSYLYSILSEYLTEETELKTNLIRSSDYEEVIVTHRESGEIVFKGAKCYGFRNLQNVVRKVGKEAGVQVGRGAAGKLAAVRAKKNLLNRKARENEAEKERGYDYVEVMACPGGCVNGGGQLKPITFNESGEKKANGSAISEEVVDRIVAQEEEPVFKGAKWGDKEWTKKVEEAYWHDLPTPPPSPSPLLGTNHVSKPSATFDSCNDSHQSALERADMLAGRILAELCKPQGSLDAGFGWGATMDDRAEEIRRSLFRTQYRAVESDIVGLQVKW